MKIKNEGLQWLLTVIATMGFRLLFVTLRKEFHLAAPQTNPYIPAENEWYTYCVWHDSLVIPVFAGKQPATMALVGRHGDGNWVSNLLNCVGIGCVRGSSSRGGVQAIREILEHATRHHLVITPDGPRGPQREMKEGCLFLSAKTNKPIVPTAFASRRAWYLGTGWTDLMIPKPFTRIIIITGEPITIPPDLDRESLKEYTAIVQQEMDRLNQQAAEMAQSRPSKAS